MYDLCLKLKNVGFPFKRIYQKDLSIRSIAFDEGQLDEFMFEVDGVLYQIPTVDEIIEELPKTKIGLNQNTEEKKPIEHLLVMGYCGGKNATKGEEWYAGYEFHQSIPLDENGLGYCEFAPSLKEALINLYIALNK